MLSRFAKRFGNNPFISRKVKTVKSVDFLKDSSDEPSSWCFLTLALSVAFLSSEGIK